MSVQLESSPLQENQVVVDYFVAHQRGSTPILGCGLLMTSLAGWHHQRTRLLGVGLSR